MADDIEDLFPLDVYGYGVWVESDTAGMVEGTITFNVLNHSPEDFTNVQVTNTLCDAKTDFYEPQAATEDRVKPGEYLLYTCEFTAKKSEVSDRALSYEVHVVTDQLSETFEATAESANTGGTAVRILGEYELGDVIEFSFHMWTTYAPGQLPTDTAWTATGSACDAPPDQGFGDRGIDYAPRTGTWFVCDHTVTAADVAAGQVANQWELEETSSNTILAGATDVQVAQIVGADGKSPASPGTPGDAGASGDAGGDMWFWMVVVGMPVIAFSWVIWTLRRKQ